MITDFHHLVVSITDQCNLKCNYCFNQYRDKNPTILSVQDIKDIYDKYEPTLFQLFGGEPTLRWNDILEIIDYVVPKMKLLEKQDHIQRHIAINTNGTTNIDWSSVPKEYQEYLIVDFSCDGFENMTDKNRGNGTYKKVIEAMKKCKQTNIHTCMICTRIPEDYLNDNRLEEFIDYLVNDIKIEGFTFSHILEPHSPNMDKNVTSQASKESIKLLKQIARKYKGMAKFYIDDRTEICSNKAIHIHSNGYINPKCVTLKPIVGHWTEWSKKDLIKWLNYCERRNFSCKATNYKAIEDYRKILLKLKGDNNDSYSNN